VHVDGDGDVVTTGTFPVAGGLNDFHAIKYSAADGARLWEQRYHDRPDSSYNVAASTVDRSGDVVVTGPGRTVKFAVFDGRLLWERPTPFDVQAIAVDGSGNVVVTGPDTTARYAAADGALLWESSSWASALALDGNGNVLLTGNQSTAKLAAVDGALLWRIDTPLEDAAVAVGVRGDVVVTGTAGYTRNAFNYYTAAYASANGALLWQKTYNGPAGGYDFTRARRPLAVGPGGSIAVTGYSSAFANPLILFGSTSAYDFATVVYRELPYNFIERIPGGVRLRCFGEPGRLHQLWRSSTVAGRGEMIHEQSIPPAGSFEFIDPTGPADAAFYHLEVQP
jgi:outer membrane protein assembly factor BamB